MRLPCNLGALEFGECDLPADLVDLKMVCPSIRIELRYASRRNIFGEAIYPKGARCLLRRKTAERLARVQKTLRASNLGLKIWDAYRPLSAQKALWRVCPDSRFVAPPNRGSIHNRGCAVDLTLVNESGKELEMPSGFDSFSGRAKVNYKGGTPKSRRNRDTLQKAMILCGFVSYKNEWWHFHDPDWRNYRKIDFSLRK